VTTPPAPPPPPHLDDYQSIIGKAQVDALRFLAADLEGKTIKMVNSTAVGGGVAEMLNRLVP
jgi:trehalose synthase